MKAWPCTVHRAHSRRLSSGLTVREGASQTSSQRIASHVVRAASFGETLAPTMVTRQGRRRVLRNNRVPGELASESRVCACTNPRGGPCTPRQGAHSPLCGLSLPEC